MDKRLLEAALSGNTKALLEIFEGDPNILATVALTSAETPLHIAALYGHVDFTRAILQQWPAFAQELNQDGFSPMHMASANGHLDIVTLLLEFGREHSILSELCLQKSTHGRNPLHYAVIKGRVHVIGALLHAYPESVRELTDQGETVLHLVVKNNQREAFQFLVQKPRIEELFNFLDVEGNTVLHLATANKQHQIVRLLLSLPNINVNAANSKGLTSLDILLMFPNPSDDIGIGEMLRAAGGEKSHNPQLSMTQDQTPSNINEFKLGNGSDHKESKPKNSQAQNLQLSMTQGQTPSNINESTSENGSDSINVFMPEKWMKEMRSGIMMMATLIATVTFQAGLTPPGNCWQDSGANNNTASVSKITAALPPTTDRLKSVSSYDLGGKDCRTFLILDTMCFMTSLFVVLLLISPMVLKYLKYFIIIILVTIYMTVFFAQLVFVEAIKHIPDEEKYGNIAIYFVFLFWIGGGVVVLLDVILLCIHMCKKIIKCICK